MNLALLLLLSMFSGISHARSCSKLESFIRTLHQVSGSESIDQKMLEAILGKKKISAEDIHLAQSIHRKILHSNIKGSQVAGTADLSIERLKPIFKDIDDANTLGYELQELEDKLRVLNGPTNFTGTGAAEVKQRMQAISKQITVLNDQYVEKMHRLYQENGLPTLIVDNPGGFKVLQLDFTKPSEKAHAFNFFRRIHKKSGLEQITVSIKETAEHGFGGFFMEAPAGPGDYQRMELGFEQGFQLLGEMVGGIGKHESRHAIFSANRLKGVESIFHTRFHASPSGHLLNPNKIYDSYLSAEEIYTYSTDFKAATSLFRQSVTKEYVIQYLKSVNSQFNNILVSNQGITEKVLLNLDALMKKPMDQGWKVFKTEEGQYAIRLEDDLGRLATLDFVSARETRIVAEALKAPDAEKAMRPVFELAQDRLQKLNAVSKTQLAESQKLDQLIRVFEESPDGGTREQMLQIREQMYKIGKNVNVDYKGNTLKK